MSCCTAQSTGTTCIRCRDRVTGEDMDSVEVTSREAVVVCAGSNGEEEG